MLADQYANQAHELRKQAKKCQDKSNQYLKIAMEYDALVGNLFAMDTEMEDKDYVHFFYSITKIKELGEYWQTKVKESEHQAEEILKQARQLETESAYQRKRENIAAAIEEKSLKNKKRVKR